MSHFTSLLLQPDVVRKAPRTVTLPPSAFADSWRRKPQEPIKVGLRLVSEQALEQAERMAAQAAWDIHARVEDHDLRVGVFNDHVVTNTLAQACVLAEDVTKHFFAPGPEDLIRQALTPGGIRRLWAEYERAVIEDCPTGEEPDAEELRALAELVASGLADLDPTKRRPALRLLKRVHDLVT